MIRRLASFLGCCVVATVGAVVAAGCGGEDNGRTTAESDGPEPFDRGSAPVLCSLDDDYELQTIQDFETGSVTGGWYFNNDRCDKCQKVIDRLKEISAVTTATNLESSTFTVYPDKYGCSDWRLFKRADESQEIYEARSQPVLKQYEAEKKVLEKQLIEGDPENNVPPNCRAVCEASQFPNAYIKPLDASRIEFTTNGKTYKEQPRCGSRFAMHVKGQVPFQTWGGVFAVQLGNPGLNADGWDGISFWARVGPTSRHPLRIEISDPFNDDKQMLYLKEGDEHYSFVTRAELSQDEFDVMPPGDDATDEEKERYARAWCNPANRNFSCNPDSIREDRNGCDKYGANRSMDGDWQFFTIDFSTMRQSGWGMPVTDPPMDPAGLPAQLHTGQLRSLNFMWTTGNWDIWIDDIALYRRKRP